MASNIPKHIDTVVTDNPPKVLTAGFNSPVPACTLQVSNHFIKTRRQAKAIEPPTAPAGMLEPRSWFDRILAIF
jgi:hypothetical protein